MTEDKPRYGVDAYLDWVARGGPAGRRGLRHRPASRSRPRMWPRAGVKSRGGASQGPRRLRQHVPVRHSARRLDGAAAPSLRRRHLRARRHRHDPDRVRRRPQAQLRMGPAQPVRDPAQRQAPPLQRQRPRARAARLHHRPAAGDEHVPRREIRVRHRLRVRRAHRQERVLRRRGRPHHRAAGQPHVGDQFRPRPRGDRAQILGRPRRRRHQHHVRARRRHHARPHLGNAGRHLQEGPPPRPRLPRDVRHRPRLLARCGSTARRISTRLDWNYGMVFPPADQQFHQHFNASQQPARYLATGVGGLRYPLTLQQRRSLLGVKPARRARCRSASRRAATRSSTRTRTRASTRSGSTR